MSAAAKIHDAAPVLCVNDSRRMIDYFVEKLGFKLQGSVGDLPSWASLARDGTEVMIVCRPSPPPAADWSVYLYVTGSIDALHDELKERGADIATALNNKPYGLREFEVRLPDARLIAFGANI